MTMINCSKEKYRQALAERTPTRAEIPILSAAAKDLFNYTQHGRTIQPCTWLMILRAHTRGNIALDKLRRKYRWTARGMRAALEAQGRILAELQEKCPDFFAGMLTEPEPLRTQEVTPAHEGVAA